MTKISVIFKGSQDAEAVRIKRFLRSDAPLGAM